MKRILVKEGLNARTNSLGKLLREDSGLTADLNKRIIFLRKSLREGERSEQDIEALKDIQNQFDCLIGQMMKNKLLLAGYEIGGDDAYYSALA
jgi:hypothetical protein